MYRGSSMLPKIWMSRLYWWDVVGEHSHRTEAAAARRRGALRRENVGMSNHNPNEKLGPRKSKVSVALAINHGLGGPKAIPKGAADGKTVNIPSRPCGHSRVRRKEGGVPYWFGIRGMSVAPQGVSRVQREGSVFAGPTPSKSLPRKAR